MSSEPSQTEVDVEGDASFDAKSRDAKPDTGVDASLEIIRARDPRRVVALGLATALILGLLWWWLFHPTPEVPPPPPTAPARLRGPTGMAP